MHWDKICLSSIRYLFVVVKLYTRNRTGVQSVVEWLGSLPLENAWCIYGNLGCLVTWSRKACRSFFGIFCIFDEFFRSNFSIGHFRQSRGWGHLPLSGQAFFLVCSKRPAYGAPVRTPTLHLFRSLECKLYIKQILNKTAPFMVESLSECCYNWWNLFCITIQKSWGKLWKEWSTDEILFEHIFVGFIVLVRAS